VHKVTCAQCYACRRQVENVQHSCTAHTVTSALSRHTHLWRHTTRTGV